MRIYSCGNEDKSIDEWFKNDVWCVGVTYYFFIHGHPPFVEEDDSDAENYFFSYDEQRILTFSNKCKKFSQAIIRSLLNPNYDDNLSAKQILDEYFV